MELNIVPRDTTLEAIRIQFSIFWKIGIEEHANMAIELSDGLRATIQSVESVSDTQSTMIIWYD